MKPDNNRWPPVAPYKDVEIDAPVRRYSTRPDPTRPDPKQPKNLIKPQQPQQKPNQK